MAMRDSRAVTLCEALHGPRASAHPSLHVSGPTVPCATGCTFRGRHTTACGGGSCDCACHRGSAAFRPPCDTPGGCGPHLPDPDCRGCEPRPSIPKGHVCVTCWDQATDACLDLPDLYDDLLSPAKYATRTGMVTSTSVSPPLPLADGPRVSRSWIRDILHVWAVTLSQPAPSGRALTYPASDEPRVTAARLNRHADWLLSHPEHAGQFAHDMVAAAEDGRRTVQPTTAPGVTLGACPVPVDRYDDDGHPAPGPCGAHLRAYPDRPLVTCPGCATTADVWWWRDLLLAPAPALDTPGPEPLADAYSLATWLSGEHQRPITADVIRQWASQGTRTAGRLPRATTLLPVAVILRTKAGRTLYDVRAARDYARTLYGTPIGADRQGSPVPPLMAVIR